MHLSALCKNSRDANTKTACFLRTIHPGRFRCFISKNLLLAMKLTTILLFVACMQVSARGFSQWITLSGKNVSLEKVFNEISRQAGYEFFYNTAILKNAKKISIDVRNASLKEVLDLCFSDQPLSYTIYEKTIVVKPRPAKETTSGVSPMLPELPVPPPPIDVRGQVTNDLGESVPGATVTVKGTGRSTSTDGEGYFSLDQVDGNATLIISGISIETYELPLQGRASVSVVVKTSIKGLNQLVVVGYATQKKVNLTGSVSVIDGADLVKRQVASTSVALQGMAPGVMVTQQSGLPGSDAATIRIRGISSMFAGQNPLVLIDNVIMNLDAIDPNNIESISILKDAAAVSIYGSRAANGVILITTKRGGQKTTSVEYNTYVGVQQATNLPQKVSALDHMKLYDIGLQSVDRPTVFTDAIAEYEQFGPDNFARFSTDWKDLVLSNNGLMHSHNLNVSGGSDRISLYASGSYLRQNGLTANTSFERFDFRFNTDIKVLKNLTASMDMVLNKTDRQWPSTSPNILMMHMVGLPAYLPGKFDGGEYGEAWNNVNPIAQAEAGGFARAVGKTNILTGTLRYTPAKGLDLLATYSSNMSRPRTRTMTKQYQVYTADLDNNVLVPGQVYPATNGLTESWNETVQNLFRTQASYTRDLGQHHFSLLGGFSTEDYESTSMAGSRQNFINPDMPYLDIGDAGTMMNSGGISQWSIVSFYSRLNYQFGSKYLLELNGRWDASSRFAEGNRWGFFPSVSAGWRLSQENFWSSLSGTIDEAKLRVSYGVLGNQNLSSFYPTVSQFFPGDNYNYFFNNTIVSGYAVTQASNPNIKWESSRQLDFGIDLGLLRNRLTITADYYKREIYNMLQVLPIPLMVGLSAPYVNAGSMENTGWELALGWRDNIGSFKYGVRFNLSDVRNRVIDLNGEEYISGLTIIRENHPIDSYFGYIAEGLFQTQAEIDNAPTHFPTTKPGDVKYRDISGADGKPDGIIDNYDRAVLGNSFPRYEYSFNLDASWKGFDLMVFFQGVGKRDNYMSGIGAWAFHSTNFQGSAYEHHKDYWTPENPNASYPRLTVGIDNNQKNSSYWIRSGAYLRLKNIMLGYTLPAALTNALHIGTMRFFVSGQNILTLDKFYPGFDPERDNNTGQFYPIMKTYSVGATMKFK